MDQQLVDVLPRVAAAVGLQEQEVGVRRVIEAIARAPESIRSISRATGLPVPIVAAVCGELRALGVVSSQRPPRLTAYGLEIARSVGADCACPTCLGRLVTSPPELLELVPALEAMEREAPKADVTLDQAHCSADTKIRRLTYLLDAGAVGGSVLLLGDDDLISVTIAMAGFPTRVTVVDSDPRLIEFIASTAPATQALLHDLREPLPSELTGVFDTVFTDPPYTVEGARLFVSRAVAALRPGPGRDLLLCFGPKGPDDTSAVQRDISNMRLQIRSLIRNFNDYLGAGVLGGTSHLYHLVTTGRSSPAVAGRYGGKLYTAE